MSARKEWIKGAAQRSLAPTIYQQFARSYEYVQQAIGSVDDLRWRLSLAGYVNHKRLCKLRNAYRGRRCFVIGNGPSLSLADLRRLHGEITIGCNGLFLIFDQMGYLPTFYTVEDRLVAEDRAVSINIIKGTTKIFPRKLAYCLKQDESTLYINFLYSYDSFPKFSAQFDKAVFWGGTVTFLNLQLAYYLGCSEVFLIGVDHNYLVPREIGQDGIIVSADADVNHFHPDYFGPGYRYHDPRIERMEQAYQAAREFGSKNGMSIFNVTRGGRLDVFPRVDFERLFE